MIYQTLERLWAAMMQPQWSLGVALVFCLWATWLFVAEDGRTLENKDFGFSVLFGLIVFAVQEIPYLGILYKVAYSFLAATFLLFVAWRITRWAVRGGWHWVHPHG